MSLIDVSDPSIYYLIQRLNGLFEEETLHYSFYDFERQVISDKTKLFILLEKINNQHLTKKCNNNNTNIKTDFTYLYSEINSKLNNYQIISIFNIKCGRDLKYKNRKDIPIQLYEGYYYSFTISYRKKTNLLN
jgi:hypothetical protein